MIECTNVTYRYPNGQGIHNVTISVPKPSVYLLAGMNGSGKSTFLKVLAGGAGGYSGEIRVDGKNIRESKPKHACFHVSLSPQYPEIQFSLATVRDELRFTARKTKTPVNEEFESEVLDILQLGAHLDESPFDLPPGKRKLLSLAIAALIPAPFTALDEPTSGIDPRHKHRVLQFIQFLHTHKGVIVVSHDIDAILPLATHVGIMHNGTIIESADIQRFLGNLRNKVYRPNLIRPFIVPRMARLLTGRAVKSIQDLVKFVIRDIHNETE